MRADRVDALPLLDEHQPVGVFDIDMAIMRQTSRFGPRPGAMPGAKRDHALAMLGGEDDVAGDEDHGGQVSCPFAINRPHIRSRREHPSKDLREPQNIFSTLSYLFFLP